MTDLRVREAGVADSAAIAQLSAALGYESQPAAVARDRLEKVLLCEHDVVWLCEGEGEALGWLHVFLARRVASADFLEIGGIAVAADTRRRGVGRALMASALQLAAQRDLELRVRCSSSRTGAHAFYRRLGFSGTKTQQVFSLQPDIVIASQNARP